MPANEAAAHLNQYATVEGVVAKVFTSKERQHVSEPRPPYTQTRRSLRLGAANSIGIDPGFQRLKPLAIESNIFWR
jgi:hypothetical protein